MKYNYIAIEGAIGAGKTTLASKMAKHYNADLLLEAFDDNTFLPKFYENPERFAFPLEMSFLAERFQQIKQRNLNLDLFGMKTVADYSLTKSLIFASANLAPDEYKLFRELYDIMFQTVPKPDLLVYLYLPVEKLLANITKRGRAYEMNISNEYLAKVQEQYFDYLKKQNEHMRILILDTSNADFVGVEEDFRSILSIVESDIQVGVHHHKV